MSWGAVVATGIGVAGKVLGGGDSGADEAAQLSREGTEAAVQRSQEAFGVSEQMMAPFAEQEYAAANQMSAQLGLPTMGGGGGGGGGTGYGGNYAARQQSEQNLAGFDNVIREMMTQAQVRYKRSGYSGSSIHREAAQVVGRQLEKLKKQGKLPQNYQMPNVSDLTGMAEQIEDQYGGHTKMAKNLYPEIKGGKDFNFNEGFDDRFDQLTEKFGVNLGGDVAPGDMQAGGPGGQVGGAEMVGAPAPQAQTAASIMERAGLTQLPPELAEQYMGEAQRMAETDPALAEYLGLTEDSMQVGNAYQEGAPYQRAIEQGTEAINVGAGAAGGLYSGSRGRELARMGHETELGYYQQAQQERDRMMQARRGQRGEEMNTMGAEYAGGLNREAAAYNNYMTMLNSMSAPTTTTNIENMRGGAARGEGAMLMSTGRDLGDLAIGEAGAKQARNADITSGFMQLAESFIDR